MTARKLVSIDPARAAMLVVDLQEEQRNHPDYPAWDFEALLARVARLVGAARAAGVPVIYGRYVRDFASLPPRAFEPLAADGGPAFSALGSPGAEICTEVAPLDGEAVFVKQAASCFANPALEAHLAACGIDTLLVSGVWTEACIAATVADAIARDLRVVLVKDACGSGTEFMHRAAVLNIANRLYGGAVTSLDQCEALLAGRPVPMWSCERPVAFRFGADEVDDLYQSL